MKKQRRCRQLEGERIFKPRSIPLSAMKTVCLELDELEAMRLVDYESQDQSQAGTRMGVSRGTIQRLLKSGREKLLSALIHNHAISIRSLGTDEKYTNKRL
jgi:predicted DNA-binding protein (UPF0251 family)